MAKKLFLAAAVMYDGELLHAGTEVSERCDKGTLESLQQRQLLTDEAPRVAKSSKITKVKSGNKAPDESSGAAEVDQNAADESAGEGVEEASENTDAAGDTTDNASPATSRRKRK